eukprot:gene14591-17061_t
MSPGSRVGDSSVTMARSVSTTAGCSAVASRQVFALRVAAWEAGAVAATLAIKPMASRGRSKACSFYMRLNDAVGATQKLI